MSYHCVENATSFEHFKLDFGSQSAVRLINHRFNQDTVVESVYPPGLYISMLGQCQCQLVTQAPEQKRDYNHQYVLALVEKTSESQILFPKNSIWQTFCVMLPLEKLNNHPILNELRESAPQAISHIKFAELGPVPSDILRCCEAAWHCTFIGFERELFIKAKAQEVLALFLNKRREKNSMQLTLRLAQLSKALSQIQADLAQQWTLSTVANLAASNRTYIKQDIKQLSGMSFRDWLKQARIEAARSQLGGSASITQIAHSVGFKSQAHFATLFKNETGITPTQYRQSLLINRTQNIQR